MMKPLFQGTDQAGDRFVLILIGGGIVAIVLAVIFVTAFASLPPWAANLFSAIVGGSLVKLADVLSTLVALASNRQASRQTERLTDSITSTAAAVPPKPDGETP